MLQKKGLDVFDDIDYDLDYAAIGSRIRAARKKLGISQAALAEKVEISTTHMSHIETGSTKLSLAAFVRISETLTVLADTLLFPTPSDEKTNLVAGINKDLNSCSLNDLIVLGDIVKAYVSAIKKQQE